MICGISGSLDYSMSVTGGGQYHTPPEGQTAPGGAEHVARQSIVSLSQDFVSAWKRL